MTDQVPDRLWIGDRALSIIEVNGSGLLSPSELGIHLIIGVVTCLDRGYVMSYAMVERDLVLQEVAYQGGNMPASFDAPIVNGHRPRPCDPGGVVTHAISGMALKMDFTGTIFCTDDCPKEPILEKGFGALRFEHGRLQDQIVGMVAYEEYRQRRKEDYERFEAEMARQRGAMS